MTHCDHDEDNHENRLRNRRHFAFGVPCQEEQGAETNLLNIHAHEDVIDGLGEEPSARIGRSRLIEHPSVEVLVDDVRHEEEHCSEAIDDGGDDHVGANNDCVDGDTWEERAPRFLA